MLETIEITALERKLKIYRRWMWAANIEYIAFAILIVRNLIVDYSASPEPGTLIGLGIGAVFFIAPVVLAIRWPYATYAVWATLLVVFSLVASLKSLVVPADGADAAVFLFGAFAGAMVLNILPVVAFIYARKWHRLKKQIAMIREI